MNSDVNITVGNYEVFGNGTVISHNSSDILFEIKGLRIRIVFQNSDNDKPDISIAFDKEDPCLQFTLTNFNNSLGISLTSPYKIGFINDRELYLLFTVHSVGKQGARMFSYTWLTKKKEEM